jgi:hypothetical protein
MLLLLSGCTLTRTLKTSCDSTSDCNTGHVCVEHTCQQAIGDDGGYSHPDGSSDDGGYSHPDGSSDGGFIYVDAGGDGSSYHPDADTRPGICNSPDGPLHPYTLKSEADTLIVGRWVHCSGPPIEITSSPAVGIEFLADGTFYLLGNSPNASYVRLLGFDNQGTWATEQTTATTVQLGLHTANGGNGGIPAFEDNPRKLSIPINPAYGNSIYALVP